MGGLLAGLPTGVAASTVKRLCGSGLDTIAMGARAIASGEADVIIAGGGESMSRAPFVLGKAGTAFSRQARIEETTIGWRFGNRLMKSEFGIDSMPGASGNGRLQL